MAKEVITDDLREALQRAFIDTLEETHRSSRPDFSAFLDKLRSELVIKDRLGHDWRGERRV
ncbi:hypothetical protein [Vitreimonas flagellata]|uniref:hypothetical protein n=1 Tax=Vitreimonas flagellata TaxID=2560861 RepID=UPI001074D3E1|nr:hypothetical protein [Vitreimonas flagellata]